MYPTQSLESSTMMPVNWNCQTFAIYLIKN
jgi:hypothetical protein